MKYLLYFSIIFMSCNSNSQNNIDDDYKILNIILEKENINTLHKFNYYFSLPKIYLKRYKNNLAATSNKKIDSSLITLNGEVKWVFSNSEIEYMINKYQKWNKGVWNKDLINKKIKYHNNKKLPNATSSTIHIISQPLYDKTKQKAIVIHKEHNGSGLGKAFVEILLLKKENNKWMNVGNLFSGH